MGYVMLVGGLKRKNIDWDERERQLKDLCNRYRRNDGRYDVIVPVAAARIAF